MIMAHKEHKTVEFHLKTKKQMKELETVKGALYRIGEYEFRFTENGLEKRLAPRVRATHTLLTRTESGWSKCNMAPDEFIHVYMNIPPEAYQGNSQKAAEHIFEQAGELASNLAKIDFKPLTAAMKVLFNELVKAYNLQQRR